MTPQNLSLFSERRFYEQFSGLLLHEHYEERRLGGAAVTLNGEELFPEVLAFALTGFDFEQLVRIVHVSRGLDLVLS